MLPDEMDMTTASSGSLNRVSLSLCAAAELTLVFMLPLVLWAGRSVRKSMKLKYLTDRLRNFVHRTRFQSRNFASNRAYKQKWVDCVTNPLIEPISKIYNCWLNLSNFDLKFE